MGIYPLLEAVKKFKHLQCVDDILITNLQQLMLQRGINEADLSRQTNVPQPTLHKILSGKTADPRISTLKTLADYFKLSIDDLYLGVLLQEGMATNKRQSAPIISWEDCTIPNYVATLSPTNSSDWVTLDTTKNKSLYALATKPCMVPRFPKGTLLIIDPELQPVDGDLIVVHYTNTTEATLRELVVDGPTKLLISLQHNAVPEDLTNDINILGTLIQSRFSYQKK